MTKPYVSINIRLKIAKAEVQSLMDTLKQNSIFKNSLDPEYMHSTELLSVINQIQEDRYVPLNDVYKRLRWKGYKRKREVFLKQVYQLQFYGLLDTFEDEKDITYIKNISNSRYEIEVNKKKGQI